MNISEHHTRTQAIRKQAEIVIGALIGKRTDHNVEIIDSFELRFTRDPLNNTDSATFVIDREFYQKKIPLVKQVNPDLDLIGWYSTTPINGQSSREGDVSLQRQISEFIPNPVYIKFDPYKRDKEPKISGSLPLCVYEPVIEIDECGEKVNHIEVSWTIVTEDVEIIGLEHNAKLTHIDVPPSVAIDNLRLQYGAVKMLKDRIKVMSRFVKDVQAGILPYHEEPINEIARLTNKFPLMSSPQYIRAYNIQCNDVALNTYLGMLTKGSMCKMHFSVPTLKTRAFSTTHARR